MMRTLKIQLAAATCVFAALASHSAWAATSGYSETWDNQGDLAGWFGSTVDSTVVNPGVGGNPGGYLEIRRSGAFDIGMTTDLAAVAGSYSGAVWTVKVDLLHLAGDTFDAKLRFRYQDPSFNGWSHSLSGPLANVWSTKMLSFDPSWTDIQAVANGWTQEAGPVVSWAQTMSNTYHPEIRFAGGPTLLVGVDNFSITAVPEPSTYSFMALGLAVLGVMVRRRRTG